MPSNVNLNSAELRETIRKMISPSLPSKESTENVTQEIYIKIIRYAQTEDTTRFFAWLKQVAKTTIADHFRKIKEIPTDNIQVTSTDDYLKKEVDLTCCVHPFLKKLPEDLREIITAVDLHQIPQKDLAKKLRLNYSTLKSKLQKARAELLDNINGCCPRN